MVYLRCHTEISFLTHQIGKKPKSFLLARPEKSKYSHMLLVGVQNGTTLTEGNLAICNKIAAALAL